MKTSFAAALLSLALPAFAGTFTAKVDYAMCGEIDPMVIGDACVVTVTKDDGKKLGLLFDFDDFLSRFDESEVQKGVRVSVDDASLSRIYDRDVLAELNDFAGGYFFMNADVGGLSLVKNSSEMERLVTAIDGNFVAARLPTGFRAVKLERLVPRAGLKAFLENETKIKTAMWKDYVLTSGEFDHVTLAERKKIAVNPLKEMQVAALLEMSEIYAVYEGSKLIGYFVEVADHVQGAIYQDGAWIDLFIDADLNVVRSFDQSA